MSRQITGPGLSVAVFVIALIIGVALFVQLPGDTRLWIEIQNTGHVPLFGVLALAVLMVIRGMSFIERARPVVGYLLSAVISLAAGIGIEFGQQLTRNRPPEITDVGLNLAGILVALSIYAVFDPRMQSVWRTHHPGLRAATLLFSVCLLLAALAPLASLVVAYQQRAAALPVIMDFSARWSGYFLELEDAGLYPDVSPAALVQRGGQQLGRLALEPGRTPGISVVEPYPDWSGYEYLVVVIYSDMPYPDRLVLRVHDLQHDQQHTDRFNRVLAVDRGMNSFRIPLAAVEAAPAGRRMQMHSIGGVGLYARHVQQPFELYLGKIWLE
jgi:hypothetical protein